MQLIPRKPARSSAEPSSGRDGSRARSRAARRVSRIAIPIAAVTGLLAFSAAATGAHTTATAARSVAPVPAVGHPILAHKQFPSPLSTTECQAAFAPPINCYTPVQYRVAYDLNPLYSRGITGAGRTIVIVDSFGSPTIQSDIKTFDAQFGFP